MCSKLRGCVRYSTVYVEVEYQLDLYRVCLRQIIRRKGLSVLGVSIIRWKTVQEHKRSITNIIFIINLYFTASSILFDN